MNEHGTAMPDDDDEARDRAVVAADDTGMIRAEQVVVEAEIAGRLDPLDR